MLLGEQIAALMSAERWPWISVGRREMAHAVAGGLVLDLVLAEAVVLDDEHTHLTGHAPHDPLLRAIVETIARRRRAPLVDGLVRDLAKPSLRPPATVAVALVVNLLVPDLMSLRAGRESQLVAAVYHRVAQRTDSEVESVWQPVHQVLTGAAAPASQTPHVALIAALCAQLAMTAGARTVCALVDLDDVDTARQLAAEFASGHHTPTARNPAVRHATELALPAITRGGFL